MDSARWSQISQLFNQAQDRPSADRESFLRDACGEDHALFEEVKSLLKQGVGRTDILDGVIAQAANAVNEYTPGERVGSYQIERELGQGGMGRVYLARRADGEFEQQVALKLIHRGMNSDSVVSRFRQERQILARLQHKNIAALLDGGITDDGRPFFALEYVEGLPIDEYCDQHALSIERRLELVCEVCAAIAHAHANLVVHRDLKPDNILIDASGEVRLLDFGIAKLVATDSENTGLTQQGLLAMTPAYASPEQARGEPVGTASDVYSLGVILYELLTGVRPYEFEDTTPTEIARVINEIEPARPSTIVGREGSLENSLPGTGRNRVKWRRQLSGDLDMICLTALRKEPERRYGSVESMRDDLVRHMKGLPVRARPDSATYRIGKALRRHRTAAVAALVLLLSTSTLATYYTIRITGERDRAQLEAAKAQEVASFLAGLFQVSDPSESLGETITARELLDAGARDIQEELASQPEVQAEMFLVIGEVYSGLGLFQQARPLLEQALAQRLELHGPAHEEVANSQTALGVLLQDIGDMEGAERLFLRALETYQLVYGPEHQTVSDALERVAAWYETNGRDEQAEEYYRRSLAMDRKLLGEDDPRFLDALSDLGGLLRRTGDMDEAESMLREALALQRRYYGDRHPEVASTARNLAALLRDKEEFAESEALYLEVIATRRALYGEHHPDVATTLNSYGLLLDRMGKTDSAIVIYEEFIEALKGLYDGPHPSLAAAYNNLAAAIRATGQTDRAIALYQESLRIQELVFDLSSPLRAFPLLSLASIYMDQGNPERAEPLLRDALAVRLGGLEQGHRYVGEAMSELGACLTALGRYEEAEPQLLAAYDILVNAEGDEASRTTRTKRRLVTLYEAQGRPERAAAYR